MRVGRDSTSTRRPQHSLPAARSLSAHGVPLQARCLSQTASSNPVHHRRWFTRFDGRPLRRCVPRLNTPRARRRRGRRCAPDATVECTAMPSSSLEPPLMPYPKICHRWRIGRRKSSGRLTSRCTRHLAVPQRVTFCHIQPKPKCRQVRAARPFPVRAVSSSPTPSSLDQPTVCSVSCRMWPPPGGLLHTKSPVRA